MSSRRSRAGAGPLQGEGDRELVRGVAGALVALGRPWWSAKGLQRGDRRGRALGSGTGRLHEPGGMNFSQEGRKGGKKWLPGPLAPAGVWGRRGSQEQVSIGSSGDPEPGAGPRSMPGG